MSRDTTEQDQGTSTTQAGETGRTGTIWQNRSIRHKIPERGMRGDS